MSTPYVPEDATTPISVELEPDGTISGYLAYEPLVNTLDAADTRRSEKLIALTEDLMRGLPKLTLCPTPFHVESRTGNEARAEWAYRWDTQRPEASAGKECVITSLHARSDDRRIEAKQAEMRRTNVAVKIAAHPAPQWGAIMVTTVTSEGLRCDIR